MTLEFSDLDTLRDISIKGFEDRIARLPSDPCEYLHQEIARLQTELEQIYRVVVLLQKHEPSMERVAEIWGKMVEICDSFGRRASDLSAKHPACRISHDRILDLRNAAEERRLLHVHP
jgi:hypothetical protein